MAYPLYDRKDLRQHVQSLFFTVTRIGGVDSPLPEQDAFASNTETAVKKIGQLAVVKLMASRWKAKAQSPTSPIAPQFHSPPAPPAPTASMGIHRNLTLSRRKTRDQATREQLISDLETFLRDLHNLTDLTIHYLDPRAEASPGENWSVSLLPDFHSDTPYGSSLRALTLSGSVTTWRRVIPTHFEWKVLERFCVRADMGFQNSNDNTYAIRLDLAPFIRRHSKTLKAVSFTSALTLDLTSLYDAMGWLPHLESLEIEQPFLPPSENHSEALNQFLFRHRDTLTSFKWSFVTSSEGGAQTFMLNPQEWSNQPPYQLTLPLLRHLHLTFPSPSNAALFEGVLFYCARHASTLTHLSLDGLTFTLPQFHEFLLLIGSKQLQELNISLEVLTSAALTNLSTKFPSLKVLRLAYASIGRQKSISEPALVDPTAGGILKIPNVSMVKMWQFRQDMAALVLSCWPVAELYLRRNVDRSWHEYRADPTGKLVVRSLQTVGFVNEMYREAFLQC